MQSLNGCGSRPLDHCLNHGWVDEYAIAGDDMAEVLDRLHHEFVLQMLEKEEVGL